MALSLNRWDGSWLRNVPRGSLALATMTVKCNSADLRIPSRIRKLDWSPAPRQITLFLSHFGLSFQKQSVEMLHMAANRVVLYFEKQEDALFFTLAASSVMSAEPPANGNDAARKVAAEISKASRITAEGVLNTV